MSSNSPTSNKTAILIIILLSYVMIVLDTSIVLTGLPSMHSELSFQTPNLPGFRAPIP
jgi:hypothetical protein